MSDLTARVNEQYTAYQTGLRESYLNAAQAVSEAQQTLAAEMFAAAGGDDAQARAGEAWRRYCKAAAEASYDYWRTVGEQQLQLAVSMSELQGEGRAAAYEWYQSELSGDGDKKKAAGPAAAKRPTRTTRSRGTRRRSDGQSG